MWRMMIFQSGYSFHEKITIKLIRILAVDSLKTDGVSYWRCVRPLTELQRTHPNIDVKFVGENVTDRELMAADLVIMYRPVRSASLKFIETCKSLVFNTKVIVDIDDNLWRIPPGHPNEIDYLTFAENMRSIYSMADGVWCSTPSLLDFTDSRDGRGTVIPNAILEKDLPDSPSRYRGMACWRGSIAQFMDIYSDEADSAFRDNHDKYNIWYFWGYWPYNMRTEKTRYGGYRDTAEYMSMLGTSGINVMWKPLADIEFNHAKSNIAWIEATMAGAICVTNFAGRPGWEWAIDKFTNNEDFIASQWAASREAIVKHYNLKKVNELRYESIIKTLEG